jgi:hypothetical protein
MPLFHVSREERHIYYLSIEADSKEEALLEADTDFMYYEPNEIMPDNTNVRYIAQEVVKLDEL